LFANGVRYFKNCHTDYHSTNKTISMTTKIIDECIEHVLKLQVNNYVYPQNASQLLPIQIVLHIVEQATAMFKTLPNILQLQGPIYILGDLHGQLTDLQFILKSILQINNCKSKEEEETTRQQYENASLLDLYKQHLIINNNNKNNNNNDNDQAVLPFQLLCLGNYINRGKYSVEVMCLLLSLKLKFPSQVHLLKGSHEDLFLARIYGFRDELKYKYMQDEQQLQQQQKLEVPLASYQSTSSTKKLAQIWKPFQQLFTSLPVCAIVDDCFFCVNSGISPEAPTLQHIANVNRFTCSLDSGIVCDLLNSDPTKVSYQDEEEEEAAAMANPNEKKPKGVKWLDNTCGISFDFTVWATREFLSQKNDDKKKLSLVIRSHQVVQNGVEWMHNGLLVTVYSASKYCNNEFDNRGGFIEIDELSNVKRYVM